MKKYFVRVNVEAKHDLRGSYLWGVENWGTGQARAWLAEIENKIFSRLEHMPLAFPIAHESKEYGREIRELKFGRYRFLFSIKGTTVAVLRIRCPFTGSSRL